MATYNVDITAKTLESLNAPGTSPRQSAEVLGQSLIQMHRSFDSKADIDKVKVITQVLHDDTQKWLLKSDGTTDKDVRCISVTVDLEHRVRNWNPGTDKGRDLLRRTLNACSEVQKKELGGEECEFDVRVNVVDESDVLHIKKGKVVARE